MQSYKEASERIAQSGNGLNGFKHTTFQEYIVRDVCKYYFELDPVLRDRPNVTAWYTNEEDSDSSDVSTTCRETPPKTVYLSSEEDSINTSLEEPRQDNNTFDTTIESNNFSRSNCDDFDENGYDSTSSIYSSHSSSTNHNSSSNISTLSESNKKSKIGTVRKHKRNVSVSISSSISPQKKKKSHTKQKFTPSQAKKIQNNFKTNKKRTIVQRNSKKSFSSLETLEQEERELLAESREKKMSFESKRHMDMKHLEEKKLEIERERLEMEKDTIRLRHENLELQNNSERSKLVLLRLEMFKQRQEIKNNNSDITEEYLNNLFPYPE